MKEPIRRILEVTVTEVRRVLAARLGWEQQLLVDRYGTYRFRAASAVEIFRTLDYGAEPISLAALLFLLRKEDVVWDIGASVGLVTVHAAARTHRVVAVEPDPATFGRMCANVALNGLASKVSPLQLALSDREGTLELATDGLDGMAPVLGSAGLGRHGGRVAVRVETLDRLVEAGESRPTVIKIDVEGAEMQVLKGARGILETAPRPRVLFVELHPQFLPNFGSSSAQVIDFVRGLGYLPVVDSPQHGQSHLVAVAAA